MTAHGYRAQRGKGHESYPRELLQPTGKRMSAKALGILVHLCSLPPGFKVSAESLARNFHEGRVAIATGLDELEGLGHLARKRIQDPETGYWGWIWVYGVDPYDVAALFGEAVAQHLARVEQHREDPPEPDARNLRSV